MVKRIEFDSYNEESVKAALAVLRQWPGAGPAEIAVKINGATFVLNGPTESASADQYFQNLLDQANALQQAFGKK